MWGISRAANISPFQERKGEETKALLLCPSDPRSIVKTMANLSTENTGAHICFYIVEEHPSILARHLLLIYIIFDKSIPIRQRTQMFIEVFSNAKVSEKSAVYIKEKAPKLIDWLLDNECLMDIGDVFDLSFLKQRDKDVLASVFESWTKPTGDSLSDARDDMLHKYYGERYDCREDLVDWDYQMYIKPIASIIHPIQFRDWRLTGIAFEFEGAPYTSSNPTIPVRSLVDTIDIDITSGPFYSIGVDCDRSNELANDLFQVHYKGTGLEQHRYTSTDIALYNVTSFIYEITTGNKYSMTIEGDVFSGLDNEKSINVNVSDWNSPKKHSFTIVPLHGFQSVLRKQRLKNHFFDSVFVSNKCTSSLEHEYLYELLSHDATLFVETCRFDLAKNESFKTKSIAKIREQLLRVNARELPNEGAMDDLLIFRITT